MSFWKRNEINSAEFEALSKKITECNSTIEDLRLKFKILETNYDNLRGQFNRKLSGIKKEEEPEEKSQGINNPVILPHHGFY